MSRIYIKSENHKRKVWNADIWTPELRAKLSELWRAGFSASEIATELGRGFSRNSIIGKAHRMGLSQRKRDSLPAREVMLVSFKQCQWPEGDPQDMKNFHYCGQSTMGHGKSYCQKHYDMSYKVVSIKEVKDDNQ